MKRHTKKQRKEIYLKLAEKFELFNSDSNYEIDFPRYLCLALCQEHNNLVGRDDNNYSNLKQIMTLFPEFLLFEPTPSERVEENLPADKNLCTAWWDMSVKKNVWCEKKIFVLYLCAKMCE